MSKKEQAILGTEKVFASFEQSAKAKKVQPPTSEAEKIQRKAEGRTKGRAGCYTDRINMAFTVDNYQFIKRFHKLRGENMTEFVNHIIDDYRAQHTKDFEAFEKFIDKT